MNELIHCLLFGVKHREKYSPIVREFSINLHFLSVRAYLAVRSTFDNNLPHPSTVRHWYANSNMDCEPGIHQSCLKLLRQKADKKKEKNSKLLLSICYDEMHIRKTFQWCNQSKSMLGFPTFPPNQGNDETEFQTNDISLDEAANQVIVFMAIGINERIKLPIAYHFVKTLAAVDRADLVKSVINAVNTTGAIITNITFDGFSGNPKMCEIFGAHLNPTKNNFKTSFSCQNDHQVNIVMDMPHMIKCVRGILGNHRCLFNGNGGRIEWKFFEELVKLGKAEGFNFTHKMTQKHINYKDRKMKVDLAMQTLSKSTANSMRYLMEEGHPKFAEAGPTIEFISIFNNLTDIFNTKLKPNELQGEGTDNPFKKPISSVNKQEIFEYFEMANNYIQGLRIISKKGARVSLLKSPQQTGFKGFIVNMNSLMNMYKRYVYGLKFDCFGCNNL